MRYDDFVGKVKASVFGPSAKTAPALRRAAADQRLAEVPVNLRDYVAKVAKHAYKVTDDDVDALKQAGYSEDDIYEITAASALGAALQRLERGMQVLKESAR
jgi:alkylhydroperoxidase family enzyme